MASSDSEDFESADEEVLGEVDNTQTGFDTTSGPKHVLSLHSSIKEVGQDIVVPETKETGAGDVVVLSENKEVGKPKPIGKRDIETEAVAVPVTRRERQQNSREPKINSKPKKLGTKISSETKYSLVQPVIPCVDESANVLGNQPTATAPDMEAKLPPDEPDAGVADSNRPTPDVDPYAKFRGYSMPPRIIHCWEPGVDNNLLYGISSVPSSTKTKNDEPDVGVADSNTPMPDVDPYAKFKGYSMPPQIEQCWEDGVDNNLLYGISSAPSSTTIKNDDSNLVVPIMDKLSQAAADKPADSTWGGWGSWGVGSILSSATEGVSTLTSHVSSVLESGIGAPNPEELARINHLEKRKLEAETSELVDPPGEEPSGIFNFGQLMTSMSSITKLVESTGSKVLSGGLDTLETIGKKTMEVLQEGDPGLKKKRAIFSDSTVLSQILREAKEQAELEDKEAENKQAMRNIHFETLFDDYQGLVHLEALEMLSKQCDLKLQSLLLSSSGPALSQLQVKLQDIKETCQLPDDEDINEEENEPSDWWKELAVAEEVLGVPISTEKLSKIWNETQEWLKNSTKATETTEVISEAYSAKEIHKKAVSALAQLTAISVEQFHKGAELLLVKEKRDSAEEAKTLKQITSVLCLQVSITATNFCERLNSCTEEGSSDTVNSLITNVFLEASNSSSYIQEAFQLLIPVLQVAIAS